MLPFALGTYRCLPRACPLVLHISPQCKSLAYLDSGMSSLRLIEDYQRIEREPNFYVVLSHSGILAALACYGSVFDVTAPFISF